MFHFSEHVKLVELETLQVIVGSYGQNSCLEEMVKSSQPKFYANPSLSSTILCRKYYIFIYLGEYQWNFDILWNTIWSQKHPTPKAL